MRYFSFRALSLQWRGGPMAVRRTYDYEPASSIPGRARRNDSGQVVHTHVCRCHQAAYFGTGESCGTLRRHTKRCTGAVSTFSQRKPVTG